MATVSTLQAPKRKKNVYGKLSRAGFHTSNLGSFFDDDDDELATAKPTFERRSSVKATYTVQKTEARTHVEKPTRSRVKPIDTFDVPTSDDEISSPPRVAVPPTLKPNLVDDTKTSDALLAPWERKRVESACHARDAVTKKRITPEVSPEAQLKSELARATTSPECVTSTPIPKATGQQRATTAVSPSRGAEIDATSAAARLAARRRLADDSAPSSADDVPKAARSIPKRSVRHTEEESTPRKRARTATISRENSQDVIMIDVVDASALENKAETAELASEREDIYDFPDSSADELAKSKPAVMSPKAGKKSARRGKLTTYSAKLMPRKGISAPARLSEMIATDTDTTQPPTRSPSVSTSRKSTPHQPSTPPSARNGSPENNFRAKGTMTPKQAQLWDRLLPSDPVVPSPSALAIKDLNISGKRRAPTATVFRTLTKSQSDVPRQRVRLVDRLKASAPSSDDSSASDDELEKDIEMVDMDKDVQHTESAPDEAEGSKEVRLRASKSQSQSQSQSTTGGGPKITYSSTRSYLPEDNIEDGLMSGLATEEPLMLGRNLSRATLLSQKSAFDLDDEDDDDGGTGKIRTIHELRASGSNTRGMWDVEEALEDIGLHNVSQRSRRRTALIELATKLSDKSFASRFIRQSGEARLAAECGACPDEIADFVIAAAIALTLSWDPPEHAIRAFHQQGVITWLTQLLVQDTIIGKLVKDRRNNMSKTSQSSLAQFSGTLKKQTSLWNEEAPLVMTPRLIALKALDQLVSKIRRLGDKSGLLNASQLEQVFGNPVKVTEQGRQLDVALSISVLESLSIASLSVEWPSTVIAGVRAILPRLDTDSQLLRHTQFLALRLCLNLTNDSKRNCGLLSESGVSTVVPYLLQAVKVGFDTLESETDDERRTIALDLLVLALGIMINLTEHSKDARDQAVEDSSLLAALVETFQQGQKNMLEAESVEDTITNVTFGYLAVMLANLCHSPAATMFIAGKLPGQNLRMLTDAVEEFVVHHMKVDTMNFDGEEGKEVWGAFTEKLKAVLARLKAVELST